MIDLVGGFVVCLIVAWVVCVPLAKLTGDYDSRFDNDDRMHGNVHVPTTSRRLDRR